VSAALLGPNSLAIIGASFEEARRGKAIGSWTGFTSATLMLGPVLGGYLAENVSWRGVFFINVPLAVVILTITRSHVPESRDMEARKMDFPGAVQDYSATAAGAAPVPTFALIVSCSPATPGPSRTDSARGFRWCSGPQSPLLVSSCSPCRASEDLTGRPSSRRR
jgi:MFS family permease